MYASSESWINNISIDVWFVMIGQYLKIYIFFYLNIEKFNFKDVQIKFLAMHIINQKFNFDIFTVGISSWNMILISNDFWHKIKMYNFDPYNALLSIATNIAAAYDCFCAAGTQCNIWFMPKFLIDIQSSSSAVNVLLFNINSVCLTSLHLFYWAETGSIVQYIMYRFTEM